MSPQIEIVREVVHDFCVEFVEQPYLCYTEHGVHALLFAQLLKAFGQGEPFVEWARHRICVVQKEYPTANALAKSRRQHWDLAVIKAPLEALAADEQPGYDYLPLATALEVGLNEPEEHLREDLRRLLYRGANVDHGFALHLYRLCKPGKMISRRDWSCSSGRILDAEQIQGMLKEAHEKPAAPHREIEVLYAVAGETGEHEPGVWSIGRGGTDRLV